MLICKRKRFVSGSPYQDGDEELEESQHDVEEEGVDDPTIDFGARAMNNQSLKAKFACDVYAFVVGKNKSCICVSQNM